MSNNRGRSNSQVSPDQPDDNHQLTTADSKSPEGKSLYSIISAHSINAGLSVDAPSTSFTRAIAMATDETLIAGGKVPSEEALADIVEHAPARERVTRLGQFFNESLKWSSEEIELFFASRGARWPAVKRYCPSQSDWWDLGGFLRVEIAPLKVVYEAWWKTKCDRVANFKAKKEPASKIENFA